MVEGHPTAFICGQVRPGQHRSNYETSDSTLVVYSAATALLSLSRTVAAIPSSAGLPIARIGAEGSMAETSTPMRAIGNPALDGIAATVRDKLNRAVAAL